jgi:hypothetical protein
MSVVFKSNGKRTRIKALYLIKYFPYTPINIGYIFGSASYGFWNSTVKYMDGE